MVIANALSKATPIAVATIALPFAAVAFMLVTMAIVVYAYINIDVELWRE